MKKLTDDVAAFRVLRMQKGLSRVQAARMIGVSRAAVEQMESGRCKPKHDRLKRYIRGLGYSMQDFADVRPQAHQVLVELNKKSPGLRPRAVRQKRNYFRRITKEVRAIRILRERRGMSQLQAARVCGYARAVFGHIENGRIELPEARLRHIVSKIGCAWVDFERLMRAEVLRDELIQQCVNYLRALDDTRLDSAATVIKALLK